MKCIFCQKEIKNIGGCIKHQNGCKLNPNRIIYKSPFIEYNEKVRRGEITHKNQYILAKEKGEKWIMPEEAIEKQRLKKIGKPLSKKHKEKLSLSRSKIIEELGTGGFKHIKWYKINNIENKEYIVRGTWELKVATILNDNRILWKRKIYLKYFDNENILRTYSPDFYLPFYDKFIEVKGYFSEKDKFKMEQVLKNNDIKLIMIDKHIINKSNKEIIEYLTL